MDRSERGDKIAGTNEMINDNEIAFNDVEAFYINEIETKQSLIIQFVADNPELDKDLLGEIDQLDSTYQVLKSAAEVGQSERILDAMVLNLQMRIDILNQQLEVLEKIKNINENEKVSI
jgi:cell division FtsZ-interacting protein ZapD